MMNIAYLVAIMADLTSETWYELANDAPGHHAVLYRTGIHAILTEVSKKNAIWALGASRCTCPGTWWKTVL